MRHYLFNGNESPDEIKRILADNAEGREEMTYPKQLTEEEKVELREGMANNHIQISNENEILADARKAHKEAVKPLATDNKEIIKKLRSGYTEVTEKVYKLPNHESGFMEFVNEEGQVVSTRKLKPEERQGNIFPIARAVNE